MSPYNGFSKESSCQSTKNSSIAIQPHHHLQQSCRYKEDLIKSIAEDDQRDFDLNHPAAVDACAEALKTAQKELQDLQRQHRERWVQHHLYLQKTVVWEENVQRVPGACVTLFITYHNICARLDRPRLIQRCLQQLLRWDQLSTRPSYHRLIRARHRHGRSLQQRRRAPPQRSKASTAPTQPRTMCVYPMTRWTPEPTQCGKTSINNIKYM